MTVITPPMNSGLSNVAWSSIVSHHYLSQTQEKPVKLAIPEFNKISDVIKFKPDSGIVQANRIELELSKHGPRRDAIRKFLFRKSLTSDVSSEFGALAWPSFGLIQRWQFAGQVANEGTCIDPTSYIITPEKASAGTVLHVRRGDYKMWRNGHYFYSIDEMLECIGNQKIDWVVTDCAETRNQAIKKGLKVTDGNLKQDFDILCSASHVIGPPSTFNMLGAWIARAEVTWIMRLERSLFSKVLGKVKSFYAFDAGCVVERGNSGLLEVQRHVSPNLKTFYCLD